jgi:predicted nucleic acid-binding protein
MQDRSIRISIMIIDANIATYWFVESTLALASAPYIRRGDLIAPGLMRLEFVNALLKFRRLNQIGDEQVFRALGRLETTISSFVDDRDLLASATEIAIARNHKIYDCLYLALALERRRPLVTADRRLAMVARSLSIETELIEPSL